jgi:hypothetical protein
MRRASPICLAVALAAAACYRPIGIELELRTLADLQAVEGDWEGDFASQDGGNGRIRFTIERGRELASGELVLPPLVEPRLARIEYLRVDDGFLSGRVEPYWDFAQGCTAWTIFSGTIADGTITGRFFATCADGVRQAAGRWTARRR